MTVIFTRLQHGNARSVEADVSTLAPSAAVLAWRALAQGSLCSSVACVHVRETDISGAKRQVQGPLSVLILAQTHAQTRQPLFPVASDAFAYVGARTRACAVTTKWAMLILFIAPLYAMHVVWRRAQAVGRAALSDAETAMRRLPAWLRRWLSERFDALRGRIGTRLA